MDDEDAWLKRTVQRDDVEGSDARERQALTPDEGAALLSCDAIPVDVRADVIKVQRGRDMKSGEDDTTKKTPASVRDVPIHSHLAPLIDVMRRTSGRVFEVGNVRDVEGRAAELREHLKLAGITRPELHDGTATLHPFDVRSFRTTFATWCARAASTPRGSMRGSGTRRRRRQRSTT